MRRFVVSIVTLLAIGWAHAGIIRTPPIGPDGRVQDTPEVAVAKAEHAVAHANERINLANEAFRSKGAGFVGVQTSVPPLIPENAVLTSVVRGAPLGADGKVVDTPEVAVAKAAHAAAHVNERINLVNEAVRSSQAAVDVSSGGVAVPALADTRFLTDSIPDTIVGLDGRVLDTPEVAAAKAAHVAAHINEKINLANEAVRSSEAAVDVSSVGVTVPALADARFLADPVPDTVVGVDGRVLDTPEVAAAKAAHAAAHFNEKINLANEAVRSSEAAVDVSSVGVTVPALADVRFLANSGPDAIVGVDGRVLDTPEVAAAKAAHAAAHINEKINLVNEAARSGTVLAPGVVGDNSVVFTSFVDNAPIGPDGRVVDTPEVAVARAAHTAAHIKEKVNLVNEAAKSADVLVAAPINYGGLVY